MLQGIDKGIKGRYNAYKTDRIDTKYKRGTIWKKHSAHSDVESHQGQIQSQIQAQIQNVPQNQNKNENKSQNQEQIEKRLSEIENKLFIIDNTQNDYALKTEIENFKKDMERIKESIQKYDDEISQLITQYAEMKTKIYTIESSANKPVVEEREPEKEKSPIKESPVYKTDIFDDLNKEEKKEPTREPPSLKEKINNDDDFDDFDVEDIDEL